MENDWGFSCSLTERWLMELVAMVCCLAEHQTKTNVGEIRYHKTAATTTTTTRTAAAVFQYASTRMAKQQQQQQWQINIVCAGEDNKTDKHFIGHIGMLFNCRKSKQPPTTNQYIPKMFAIEKWFWISNRRNTMPTSMVASNNKQTHTDNATIAHKYIPLNRRTREAREGEREIRNINIDGDFRFYIWYILKFLTQMRIGLWRRRRRQRRHNCRILFLDVLCIVFKY